MGCCEAGVESASSLDYLLYYCSISRHSRRTRVGLEQGNGTVCMDNWWVGKRRRTQTLRARAGLIGCRSLSAHFKIAMFAAVSVWRMPHAPAQGTREVVSQYSTTAALVGFARKAVPKRQRA